MTEKNYRPVSNLSFLLLLLLRRLFLLVFYDIFYITILLIVFNLLIGQATVVRPLYFVCTMILSQPLANAMDHFLVLLDLSAAFDTIDHDNLFYILEKYVGIGGPYFRITLKICILTYQA